jgi:hypothetical protein
MNLKKIKSYVYIMRQYGYPQAWLMEARVVKSKLSVLDGGLKSEDENAEITSDESKLKLLISINVQVK